MVEITYATFLERVIHSIPGVSAVVVSDRDGGILVKAYSNAFNTDNVDTSLGATFAVASEQAGKLGLGKNKSIINFHRDKIIVYINLHPIFISFICSSDTNCGSFTSIVPDLQRGLDGLSKAISKEDDN
eukprot:TRINITY_DN1597_c0_g1_i1.p1 TRINITY_DN1597_c0_g1~~TRINITY_DN1597_c0_g1_i1.p1  ORF type:complete len:144 (-),score=21.14 TRINITY_DN1597_c0_g1_i1:56-442(-)